jgi:hypothetical protein
MKARLCVFLVLIAFASTASAEYYLVYPAPSYDVPCCKTCHYKKYKKVKHVVKKKHYRKRCNPCATQVYYPAPVVYSGCGACGGCGSAGGYVVYTGRPDDCVTYSNAYYNAYEYPPSYYPPESVTYSY